MGDGKMRRKEPILGEQRKACMIMKMIPDSAPAASWKEVALGRGKRHPAATLCH